MINSNITDIALDAFDRFNPDDTPIRDYLLSTESHTMRADIFDDITMIHCTLDDELADIILIATHDRDTNELHTLILHSDSEPMIINLD